MRIIALLALFAAVGTAAAEETTPGSKGKTHGEVPGHESCVEVEIGSSRAYDCLNTQLKEKVEKVAPLPNIPPLDARSPDTKLGIVNVPAVKQQYGKNYGNSVIPYRP